jgi:polyisoprenoid-binding protein YceI
MTRSTPRPPGYLAGTWTIDSALSSVAFTIRHLLVHKVRGTFGAFTGQIVTRNE